MGAPTDISPPPPPPSTPQITVGARVNTRIHKNEQHRQGCTCVGAGPLLMMLASNQAWMLSYTVYSLGSPVSLISLI